MAEIEDGEHGDKGRVRQWFARALRAPRDPAWVADGHVSETWSPVSPVSGRLDAFAWRVPDGDAGLPSAAVLEAGSNVLEDEHSPVLIDVTSETTVIGAEEAAAGEKSASGAATARPGKASPARRPRQGPPPRQRPRPRVEAAEPGPPDVAAAAPEKGPSAGGEQGEEEAAGVAAIARAPTIRVRSSRTMRARASGTGDSGTARGSIRLAILAAQRYVPGIARDALMFAGDNMALGRHSSVGRAAHS